MIRSHVFTLYSNVKKLSCFYPIPQAADCILRVVERANAPVIYLSTDAADSETGLLQSLIVLNSRPVPLVKRPARNSVEKWDALLYRHHIEGDPHVRWHWFLLQTDLNLRNHICFSYSCNFFVNSICIYLWCFPICLYKCAAFSETIFGFLYISLNMTTVQYIQSSTIMLICI